MQLCCVVKYSSDVYQDLSIEEVSKCASKLGLEFISREYNSWNYSDDRQVIRSLPAFHVYYGSNYIETFYPGDNTVHILTECIKECEKMQLETKRFLKIWRSIMIKRWKSKID